MIDTTVLLTALKRMLPSQFEEVLFHAKLPHGTISSGAQNTRALEIIRYFEASADLATLEKAIQTVAPGVLKACQAEAAPLEPKTETPRAKRKADKSTPSQKKVSTPPKLFISYAHKDEEFKDDLVLMLTTLQDENIIDAWQDRKIEPGDDWKQSITNAMEECDLALLLISKHFLASRFIKDEELPKLLQRRKDAGLRVIPIIVRSCTWDRHSILKGIQALPKDAKPVIEFPENDGSRDRVWTEITHAVETVAKSLTP